MADNSIDPNDEFELDEDHIDTGDVLEEDDFSDSDFEDPHENIGKKKSGGKFVLFLILALLIIVGAGYFLLGQSLPFMGQKTPATQQTSDTQAIAIPPAPSTNIEQAQSPTPLPPPPMPTPIGPDPDTVSDIAPPTVKEAAAEASDVQQQRIPEEDTALLPPALPEDLIEIERPEKDEATAINRDETPPMQDFDKNINETNQVTSKPSDREKSEDTYVTEDVLPPVVSQSLPQDNATAQRIEMLEQSLQALSLQLETMQQTPSSETPSADKTGLAEDEKEKLNTLSQQMLQVTHRLDQLSEKINAMTQSEKVTKTQKSTAKAVTPAKATAKGEPQKSPPIREAKPAPKPVAKQWVLRSAQPGIAWLSQTNNSEMQRYSVGQAIPGMGVIQSIAQENGKWIVKTTGGDINQ